MSDRFYIKKIQLINVTNEYISDVEFDNYGEVTAVGYKCNLFQPIVVRFDIHSVLVASFLPTASA